MTADTTFAIDVGEVERLRNASYTDLEARAALGKEHLSAHDFSALILADEADADFYEKLATRAQSLTRIRFGCVKGLYIPLYLSNACHNLCTYCGFSRNNKIKRKSLDDDGMRRELGEIYRKGFRNVLLVSGEREDFKNADYLAQGVAIARETGFHSIAVELGALDDASAKLLARAGAQSFVLYQETYHSATYSAVHPGGQKADYGFRLDGARRAIEAGFRQVTVGFLVGLYDPLFEAIALYHHLSALKRTYWDIEFSVSLPRLRKAVGAHDGFHTLGDRKYAQILMALRLAFPEASINLSTRESAPFRDGMANICATHLSVESKTQPGGYADADGDGLEQFSVHDDRSLAEMTAVLGRMGYDTHLKDWEMELNRL